MRDKREEVYRQLVAQGKNCREINLELSNFIRNQNTSEIAENQKTTASIYFIQTLLSHCAQKIYLINVGENCLGKETIKRLPSFLKNRVVITDEDKQIKRQIYRLTNPLIDEIDPLWDGIRKEKQILPDSVNGHEHSICLISESLTTLVTAIKYNCEADVDLYLTKLALSRVRTQLKSTETLSLISRIEGIFNCYGESTKIPGFKSSINQSSDILLQELLDDSDLISLSQDRYLLGIPSKAKLALKTIRQKSKEAVRNNRRYLSIMQKIGNIAIKNIGLEIPEMPIEKDTDFSPPLFALNNYKPNCLSTLRTLPSVMPSVKLLE